MDMKSNGEGGIKDCSVQLDSSNSIILETKKRSFTALCPDILWQLYQIPNAQFTAVLNTVVCGMSDVQSVFKYVMGIYQSCAQSVISLSLDHHCQQVYRNLVSSDNPCLTLVVMIAMQFAVFL